MGRIIFSQSLGACRRAGGLNLFFFFFPANALAYGRTQATPAVQKGKLSSCGPQARATKKLTALGTETAEQDR